MKLKGHDEISETQVLTKKTRERIAHGWKRLPVEATFKNEIRFFEEGQVTHNSKDKFTNEIRIITDEQEWYDEQKSDRARSHQEVKGRKHVWHKLVGCVGPEMEETFGQEKSGKVVVKRNMTSGTLERLTSTLGTGIFDMRRTEESLAIKAKKRMWRALKREQEQLQASDV